MGLRDKAIIVEEAGIKLQLTRISTNNQFWYKITTPVGDGNYAVGTIDYQGEFHIAETELARILRKNEQFPKALVRAHELVEIDKIQLC